MPMIFTLSEPRASFSVAVCGSRLLRSQGYFDAFTLVTDDQTVIGYPPGKRPTQKNTLLMYHRGERHGAWCSTRQAPRFWVVHFTVSPDFYNQAARLGVADPRERVWQLSPEQV